MLLPLDVRSRSTVRRYRFVSLSFLLPLFVILSLCTQFFLFLFVLLSWKRPGKTLSMVRGLFPLPEASCCVGSARRLSNLPFPHPLQTLFHVNLLCGPHSSLWTVTIIPVFLTYSTAGGEYFSRHDFYGPYFPFSTSHSAQPPYGNELSRVCRSSSFFNVFSSFPRSGPFNFWNLETQTSAHSFSPPEF